MRINEPGRRSALSDIIVQFVQDYLSLKSKCNEPIDEFGITNAAALPEQREHTDVSKAWYRIDLIKQRSSVGAIELSQEELTLLLGGIDLMQTKARNWYRKTLPAV